MRGGRQSALAAICLSLGVTVTLPGPTPAQGAGGARAVPLFTDATAAAGIVFRNVSGAPPGEKDWITETVGAGAAWLDFDGDGHLDLYLINGSTHQRAGGQGEPNKLYRNNGDGTFTDVTAAAGTGHRGWGYGVAAGDVDGDGDPDLYVTNLGANVLYRNNGDGTFTGATAAAGVGDAAWGTAAAFFDADGDGHLDLYVGNYVDFHPDRIPRRGTPEARTPNCTFRGVPVTCGPRGLPAAQDRFYRNNGDGTFTDATATAGFELATPRFTLGVVAGDYDNDGDTDLYAANDSVQNSLWRNRGDGTFEDVGLISLTALSGDGRPQAGMGVDLADYNGDGWQDLVVTNFSHDLNALYRSAAGRFFADEAAAAGLADSSMALSWGVGFYDFDLDGDLDLFVANGHVYAQVDAAGLGTTFRQRNHLFVQEGGRFRQAAEQAGPGFEKALSYRGAAFADYDNDGDMDILVTSLDEAPVLLRNETARQGHFLQVRLVGRAANRDGVGAQVRVTTGGVTRLRERTGGGSYLSASDPRLHFGLGAARRVERLEVRWPGGTTSVREDLPVDRMVTVSQEPRP